MNSRMYQQDYFILWSVYAMAAFILLLASIFFTSFLWRCIKEPIVLVIAILLFSPTLIDPAQGQYAPAIAVMAMDFLMQVGEHEVDIANELFYRIEIVLAIYFAFIIFIRWPLEYFFRKWWKSHQEAKALQKGVIAEYEHDEATLHADERI